MEPGSTAFPAERDVERNGLQTSCPGRGRGRAENLSTVNARDRGPTGLFSHH